MLPEEEEAIDLETHSDKTSNLQILISSLFFLNLFPNYLSFVSFNYWTFALLFAKLL